jgi:uroporphyrinogen III methyltransferase/synthase
MSDESAKGPLSGKKIMITRTQRQAGGFADKLRAYGATVVEFPTIEIVPPDSYAPLDQAIKNLASYDWIIFTSANAVEPFRARLQAVGVDARALKRLKVCAIGPATAEAIGQLNVRADVIPQEYRAESIVTQLVEFLGSVDRIKDLRILLPRAKVARDVLPEELRRLGAQVDVVAVYQTILPENDLSEIQAMLNRKEIDLVTFTSSSTVSNFARRFHTEDLSALLAGVGIACIGPITAETAARFNLQTHVMPKDYTIPALAEAIANYYSN